MTPYYVYCFYLLNYSFIKAMKLGYKNNAIRQ